METVIMIAVLLDILTCNVVMVMVAWKLLCGKDKPAALEEPEKTAEQKEQERQELEQQRLLQEGLAAMMNYTGAPPKKGA